MKRCEFASLLAGAVHPSIRGEHLMQTSQDRRRFLAALTATGAAGLIGTPQSKAQDGRLETTTVRIAKGPSVCVAPTYLAEELLRAEGFTEIRYVSVDPGPPSARALACGEIDFTTNFSSAFIVAVDAGEPITMLAGEHVGCYELFAREGIRGIPDLKGKTVGVPSLDSSLHMFVSGMASYVGLNPAKDIRWVTSTSPKPMQDAELLAKHAPDNKQRFDQDGQIRNVLDQLLDARLEPNRPDQAHLKAEVAQAGT
jgi:NitT/TauT family transport system substrate-binding protein